MHQQKLETILVLVPTAATLVAGAVGWALKRVIVGAITQFMANLEKQFADLRQAIQELGFNLRKNEELIHRHAMEQARIIVEQEHMRERMGRMEFVMLPKNLRPIGDDLLPNGSPKRGRT